MKATRLNAAFSVVFLIATASYGHMLCQGARAHVAGKSRYSLGGKQLLVLEGVRKDTDQIILQMHSLRIGETPKEFDGEISVKVKIFRLDFLSGDENKIGVIPLVLFSRSKKAIVELGPYTYADTDQNRFVHYFLHKETSLPLDSLVQNEGRAVGFQVEILEVLSDGRERRLNNSLRYLVLPFDSQRVCHKSTPADTMVFAGDPFDFNVQEDKEGGTFSASFNILVAPGVSDQHQHHHVQ